MAAHIARKRFGQHFLTAVDVIDRIVRSIAPKPGERLVEIGPGLGAMTIPLRARCDALTVIELDRDLAERLRRRGDLDVVESDVLKVISRGEESGLTVTQTRVRHIVLRPSQALSIDAAERRIIEFRQQIASGAKTFEELARQYSEDGSAQAGGDLGWASPGSFVPEFEEAMDKLPIAGLSGPVRSRFGVHLIQVLDRRDTTVDPKQLREQANNALKEQKFDPAYAEWVADLRAKAFIEYREPPV